MSIFAEWSCLAASSTRFNRVFRLAVLVPSASSEMHVPFFSGVVLVGLGLALAGVAAHEDVGTPLRTPLASYGRKFPALWKSVSSDTLGSLAAFQPV